MNHQKIITGYDKRKNSNLFECFLKEGEIKCSDIQNFSPILARYFSLNETNYNSVCFKQKNVIKKIIKNVDESHNIYKCSVVTIKEENEDKNENTSNNDKELENNKNINNKNIFFKFAPLIDPFKFLLGKYSNVENILGKLPNNNTTELTSDIHHKLVDVNNCAYVDGMFSFLSSHLLHNYNFIHSLEFYGSFVAIKENYKINVAEDIEYLDTSDYFKKNKGVKFQVDDYSFLINQIIDDDKKKPPIRIDHNITNKSNLSIHSITDDLYSDLFEKSIETEKVISLEDLKLGNLGLLENPELEITNEGLIDGCTIRSIRSNSSATSCSSRTSYTDVDEKCGDNGDNGDCDKYSDKDVNGEDEDDWEDCSTIDEDDIYIEASIPQFPKN